MGTGSPRRSQRAGVALLASFGGQFASARDEIGRHHATHAPENPIDQVPPRQERQYRPSPHAETAPLEQQRRVPRIDHQAAFQIAEAFGLASARHQDARQIEVDVGAAAIGPQRLAA